MSFSLFPDRAVAASAPDAPLMEAWRICRRGLAAATAFGLFINILALTLPIYMMQLFDRVLTSRSLETLAMLSLVAAGMLLAHAALTFIRQGVMTRVSAAIETTLAEPVLDAALRARSERGAANQAVRDVGDLRNAAASPALQAIFDIPWAPLFLIVIFFLHSTLGFVATGGALLLIALAGANAFLAREAQMKATTLSIRSMTRLDSFIASADAVMSMGMTRRVRRRWLKSQEEILDFQGRVGDAQAAFQNLTRFLRMVLQAGMLAIGAWLVIDGAATPGAMLASSIIMARALAPVEQAIGGWRQLELAWAAYRRVKALLLHAPRPDRATALPEPKGRLTIEKLAYAPPGAERPILKGLDLEVEPGETVGLVGPSGAGKSTLARMIVGAHKPTLGGVRLDGVDVSSWDENERGQFVGYMPQEPHFIAGTIRDNIARLSGDESEDADAIDAAVVEAAQLAGAHELILKLPQGYDTMIAEPNSIRLSGGQKQRLSFARALFGRPRMLVLDEPTVHLDPPGEEALARALGVARRADCTIILVTHRISLVTRADRVAVIRDGRIERIGPPAEVAKSLGAPGGQPKQNPARTPAANPAAS